MYLSPLKDSRHKGISHGVAILKVEKSFPSVISSIRMDYNTDFSHYLKVEHLYENSHKPKRGEVKKQLALIHMEKKKSSILISKNNLF